MLLDGDAWSFYLVFVSTTILMETKYTIRKDISLHPFDFESHMEENKLSVFVSDVWLEVDWQRCSRSLQLDIGDTYFEI